MIFPRLATDVAADKAATKRWGPKGLVQSSRPTCRSRSQRSGFSAQGGASRPDRRHDAPARPHSHPPGSFHFSRPSGSFAAWGSHVTVTFGEYAERWVANQCELACAGLVRANTVCRFESALAAHLIPFLGGYPSDALARDRCESFRTTLFISNQLAPRTINGIVAVLRLILRRAIQDGAMSGPDPTVGIRQLFAAPRRINATPGSSWFGFWKRHRLGGVQSFDSRALPDCAKARSLRFAMATSISRGV